MISYCTTSRNSLWCCFPTLCVCVAALVSSGCGTQQVKLAQPVRVRTEDEAATVLVTPSMVAPWSYVSAALKPAFTMTGDTAVGEVLPTTEEVSSQVLNAFGASLGVGLPGSSTSSSSGQALTTANGSNTSNGVTTTTASRNGTTNSTTTTTTTPGVAPTAPTGTPAGGQLPAAPALTGGLSLDPVLKYKAAAYLNQEVQLLNQEIDNAAVRECFVPYVVKLKLAVMNYRPYLAYSIHTRISFVPGSAGETPPTTNEVVQAAKRLRAAELLGYRESGRGGSPAGGAISLSTDQVQRLKQDENRVQSAYVAPECAASSRIPVVVPFLVADDMQVALKSEASEIARQFATALNFMVHGVGGNASLNDLKATLTSISSQDLSSVLTVARDNDNTLYIRIAPSNQASNEPSLVGQTYDVAVLLLVPRRYFVRYGDTLAPASLSLVTYTQFRDATSGEVLAPQPDAHYVSDLNRILTPYLSTHTTWWQQLPADEQMERAKPLLNAIVVGNLDEFRENLAGGLSCQISPASGLCFLNSGLAPALWAGMSSVLSDSSYKSAGFEAPIPAKITIPAQTVLVADDKTHSMQALISGVGGLTTATLAAHLNVAVQSKLGGATIPETTMITIPAQSLTLDPVAHVLTLTFPSLGKNGLLMPTAKTPPSQKRAACTTKKQAKGAAANSGTSGGAPSTATTQCPTPTPPQNSSDAKDNGSGPTIAPDDPGNALIVERVACDPMKELCPVLEGPGTPPVGDWSRNPTVKLAVRLASIAKSTPSSIATITAEGSVIGIERDSSSGVLPIVVSLPDSGLPSGDSLNLSVTGAPVVTAWSGAGAPLALGKHGYVLPQAGAYSLDLLNLMPGTAVTVSIQAIKSDGKTLDGDPVTATYTAVPLTNASHP
jgi:hypothetical protein